MTKDLKTDDRTSPKGIVELDEKSIAAVSGGLNPQPLPPGGVLRFG